MQLGNASGVIGVVVGDQNVPQRQSVLGQGGAHWRCVARIHHQGIVAVVQQPDVVIGERGDRKELHGAGAGGWPQWIENAAHRSGGAEKPDGPNAQCNAA